MRSPTLLICALALAAGCGGGIEESDAGGRMDASAGTDASSVDGARPVDAGEGSDTGPPGFDAGPPQPCDAPGSIESVACGRCGSVERFCTAERTWAYGLCQGEGGCEPGSLDRVACGNCGTQSARCTASCEWEATGTCEGEGPCTPGTRSRSGAGCAAGETREVVCNASCALEPAGVCESDGCPTPGALERVSCGMCGTQDRFCTSTMVWEYGVCTGEGGCTPGTTEPMACGMCGTRTRRCTSTCTWDESGACTGEGSCAPGTSMRTSSGCSAGQTRLMTCNEGCVFVETMGCTTATAVDVTLLFDMTGSHGSRVDGSIATIVSRLVDPLLAAGDVAVGVSYYAEFPGSGFPFPGIDAGTGDGPGDPGDRPFAGGIEPVRVRASIETELGRTPNYGGGDIPESGIEALFVLTGGTPHRDVLPLACSAGRAAGGCWRSGARRVIVVYTDASNHNGPDPASTGIFSPYAATLGAASWSSTRTRLLADGTYLVFLHYVTSSSTEAAGQFDEMLTDLGQSTANRIDATSSLGTACDAAVARIRALTGI